MSRKRSTKRQAAELLEMPTMLTRSEQQARYPVMTPRNSVQKHYLRLLQDASQCIVCALGPAGTGKTLFAMQAGIQALKDGRVERLILTRPAVGVEGEDLGYLPGDLNSKMAPWTQPLMDVLRRSFSARDLRRMLENQEIELAPLMYMRGRNFDYSWVVADEMQNSTPAQMKMLLTRISTGSKIVITGDLAQTDRDDAENGLLHLQHLLQQSDADIIAAVQFQHQHIERHPAVAQVLALYGDA